MSDHDEFGRGGFSQGGFSQGGFSGGGVNRLMDDLAKLATNAAGVAQGAREEAETLIRSRIERWIADRDLVTREEFEAVREMAALAREENEQLASRIDALEKRLAP